MYKWECSFDLDISRIRGNRKFPGVQASGRIYALRAAIKIKKGMMLLEEIMKWSIELNCCIKEVLKLK